VVMESAASSAVVMRRFFMRMSRCRGTVPLCRDQRAGRAIR